MFIHRVKLTPCSDMLCEQIAVTSWLWCLLCVIYSDPEIYSLAPTRTQACDLKHSCAPLAVVLGERSLLYVLLPHCASKTWILLWKGKYFPAFALKGFQFHSLECSWGQWKVTSSFWRLGKFSRCVFTLFVGCSRADIKDWRHYSDTSSVRDIPLVAPLDKLQLMCTNTKQQRFVIGSVWINYDERHLIMNVHVCI